MFLLVTLAGADAAAEEDVLPPQIVHEPCTTYEQGRVFVVEALFYDDSALFGPKLVYRTKKFKRWRGIPFEKSGDGETFAATIKARGLKGTLEYFIEIYDENGNGPTRYGSKEMPVRIFPADGPSECDQTGQASGAAGSSDGTAAQGDDAGQPGRKAGRTSKSGHADTSTDVTAGPGDEPPSPDSAANWASRPPSAAPSGCSVADPPAYCSPLLWILVGAGVVVATSGSVLAWCFAGGPCKGEGPGEPVPDRMVVEVGTADFNSAFGLSF